MNTINKNTFRHRWLSIAKNFKFLPEEQFVKVLYECYTAQKLDLDNPVTFNEKIQWYKVFYKNPLLTQLVDKYRVRPYVEERIGAQYLNDLLGVYNHPDEIDYNTLPERFVLKGVHGCRFNLIVKDKSRLNKKKARREMLRWLNTDYYRKGKEWAYKYVPRCIIAEAFLEEKGKEVLNDYKFFCFDGKVAHIQVDLDRGIHNYRCYYTTDWEKLPFSTHKNVFFEGEIPQPKNLLLMIELAEKLAKGLPFVRVDLYNVDGKIYFGEMTFYPTNGLKLYRPEKYNKILGDYFTLPEKIV